MSEETKKALEAYLLQLVEASKQGAAWAKDQIPLVLQEKLVFDFYSALFTVIALLLASAVLFYTRRWVIKLAEAQQAVAKEELSALRLKMMHDNITVVRAFSLGVVGFLHAVLILPPLWTSIMLMVKIKTAPRLYILEWAMELVRSR